MKLATYLETHSISSAAFGRSIGVSKQTMFKYVHGHCFPPPDVLWRIAEVTKDKVNALDFVDQHKRAAPKAEHAQAGA